MTQFTPILGLVAMIALCLVFSADRRAALKRWPLILWGLGLQFLFAFVILRVPAGKWAFEQMNDILVAVIGCTQAGASFVFGAKLTDPSQGLGFFAFYVLPTIIFFSALSALLYQMGIMQAVVKAIAWVMLRTMKTSGAETLSASANIFLGQTEAPLLVRPFIPHMTRSELMCIMTGGFATVAGGVMAAYIAYLKDEIPGIAGHLLAASVMSAPAALLFSKILVPETETPKTLGSVNLEMPKAHSGLLDAAAGGASDGVGLALNVAGMIIAFLALVAVANLALQTVGGVVAWPSKGEFALATSWSLENICGYLFVPLAWLMGVPNEEVFKASQILGLKTITNEFVAYLKLGDMSKAGEFSVRTRVILSYALCGFANLGSIGIQIGALSVMAPQRRGDLAKLGFAAMVAGTLACQSTACVAALLYQEEPVPAAKTASLAIPASSPSGS